MNSKLPVVRSHERMTFKRCQKKWYWSWRRGLVPRAARFGALELGTWLHAALADWYGSKYARDGRLVDHFNYHANLAMPHTNTEPQPPEHVLEKAEELAALGESMTIGYEKHYGSDPDVKVIKAELPLQFEIPDESGKVIAVHAFKPDLVYEAPDMGVWLMEHKSATSIRTEHLVIDDQARPYGTFAERALRNAGMLKRGREFKGIMYNYLRKGLSDERSTNELGQALNKNGTVSARQPSPLFVRKPVTLTSKAKLITLRRVQKETITITEITKVLRANPAAAQYLNKTPHVSCPKFCEFFSICTAEEEGTDIRTMENALFVRRNPYTYGESTDDPAGFEIG